MSDLGFPALPMYTHDQAAYVKQMYEWHTKMGQYHDQQKAYHMERAQQFQQFMGGSVHFMPQGTAKRSIK